MPSNDDRIKKTAKVEVERALELCAGASRDTLIRLLVEAVYKGYLTGYSDALRWARDH